MDLGAERLVAAEQGQEKIAVEIKSFLGASDVRDLEMAIGQYVFYRSLLTRLDPARKLFLAVPYSVLSVRWMSLLHGLSLTTSLSLALLLIHTRR